MKMKRIESIINAISIWIAVIGLGIVILLIGGNVFSRYLFSKSYSWAEELSYILFTWSVFFGASEVFGKRGLICIDVFISHFPKAAQKLVFMIIDVILLFINICLIAWTIMLMQSTSRITPMLRISYVYVYFGMLLSFIFSAFHSVKFLVNRIRGGEIEAVALEERS